MILSFIGATLYFATIIITFLPQVRLFKYVRILLISNGKMDQEMDRQFDMVSTTGGTTVNTVNCKICCCLVSILESLRLFLSHLIHMSENCIQTWLYLAYCWNTLNAWLWPTGDKKYCKTMSTTRVRSFQMQARISGPGILVAQDNDQSVMRDLQRQHISKVATSMKDSQAVLWFVSNLFPHSTHSVIQSVCMNVNFFPTHTFMSSVPLGRRQHYGCLSTSTYLARVVCYLVPAKLSLLWQNGPKLSWCLNALHVPRHISFTL